MNANTYEEGGKETKAQKWTLHIYDGGCARVEGAKTSVHDAKTERENRGIRVRKPLLVVSAVGESEDNVANVPLLVRHLLENLNPLVRDGHGKAVGEGGK